MRKEQRSWILSGCGKCREMTEAAELVRRTGCVGLVLHLSLSVCPQQVTTSLHCGVPIRELDARIFIYFITFIVLGGEVVHAVAHV